MTPDQIHRLTTSGVRPFDGELDTAIQRGDLETEAGSVDHLWREFRNSIGEASRHLESIIDEEPTEERAKMILEVIRDPEAFLTRLQAAQRQAASRADVATEKPAKSDLIKLLSQRKPDVDVTPSRSHRMEQAIETGSSAADSQLVEDDGTVRYGGKTFSLYRRYAGKPVTVIEDGEVIRFSIEGKVLSKTYPRKEE